MIFLAPVADPTSDAAWYFNQGIALSEGRGYQRNGEPTAFWPIGYPAFLGALFYVLGPSVLVALSANLALSALSFVLLLATARKIAGEETTARLAVLIWTLYPNSIGYTGLVLTETLFTTLLLLACWLYLRRNSYPGALVCGLVFGLATLVKTQTVLIPLVLIGFSFFFVSSSRFSIATVKRGFVIVIAMFITIAPWTFRNHQVFDEFVLVSTNGGIVTPRR